MYFNKHLTIKLLLTWTIQKNNTKKKEWKIQIIEIKFCLIWGFMNKEQSSLQSRMYAVVALKKECMRLSGWKKNVCGCRAEKRMYAVVALKKEYMRLSRWKKNVCGCRAENLLISLIARIILVIENYSLGGYITFIHLVRTQHLNFVQEGFFALEKLHKWRRKWVVSFCMDTSRTWWVWTVFKSVSAKMRN